MAMNLRLDEGSQAALRAEAERSGKSQQEIVRDALHRHLELVPGPPPAMTDSDALVALGAVRPPRSAYRKVVPTVVLPPDVKSLNLLDRDDRL